MLIWTVICIGAQIFLLPLNSLFLFDVKEQLREKEQRVLELERRIEEKDRELHTIRLDNEAVRLDS